MLQTLGAIGTEVARLLAPFQPIGPIGTEKPFLVQPDVCIHCGEANSGHKLPRMS